MGKPHRVTYPYFRLKYHFASTPYISKAYPCGREEISTLSIKFSSHRGIVSLFITYFSKLYGNRNIYK